MTKQRKKENIYFLIAGLLAIGLSFINNEWANVFLYRMVFGTALITLTMAFVLAASIAPLRTWTRLSKCAVSILLVVFHLFTNRIWVNNHALTIVWIVLAGYLCIDSNHPQRFYISLVFSVIATPFSFFESTTMVSFWILAANGLLHIFLNNMTVDRFCSFFLFLASASAGIALIPIFAETRLGMIVALLSLCWGFYAAEFHEMSQIRKENEEVFQRERNLARIEEKALKEEIRPHFLLNALNNVQVAFHESKEDGRELLNALIRLETTVVEISKAETIPLQQEVTISRDLISLFEYERKCSILFEVDIDDPFLPIPPLLLEPLVENSLQHSGVLRQDGGKITIREWNDHGFATIIIRDNGSERPLPSPARGIGLSNVQRRVGLLDEGKMSIFSDEEGTTIEITFRMLSSLEENGTA